MRRRSSDLELAELVRSIKLDIIFGRLRPRERLVEDDLVAQFNASRHLVRAAFVELEQLGIVVRRPNRGAIVRDYTAREIDEVYEMRAHLQAEAERRMPMPANRELTAQLLAIYDTYGQAIDSGDLPTVCALNSAFHRRIWASCGNAYLTQLLERIWSETLGICRYGIADPHLLARARREHAEMIAMLETGDREGFSHVSLNHIWPALEAFKLSQGRRNPTGHIGRAEKGIDDVAFL